jgi:hypothetical protein
MSEPIKYSTTIPSGAVLKSSTARSVVDGDHGPTSSTGWYSGLRQAEYTIIKAQNGAPLLQYTPSNNIEFIQFCNTTASPSPSSPVTTIDEALEFLSNSGYMVLYGNTPPDNFPEGLPMDGLSMYVDSQIDASIGTPNKWLDVSGNGLKFDSYGTALNLESIGGYPAWRLNGSGYFQCNDKYGAVNMGGDCTLVMWLYCTEEGVSERDTIFEKIGNGNTSYQGEIAVTWETSNGFSYYSRKTPAYDSASGGSMTTGAWNMMAIKMSTGLTSSARTGFRSKNGAAWSASYNTRSTVALVPSLAIRLGTGYAGPVEGENGMGAFLTYNKMLSSTEISNLYNATKGRYGL